MTSTWSPTEHTTDHQWRMFMRLLDTGLDTSGLDVREPKEEGDPLVLVAGDRTLEIAAERPDPMAEALADAPGMSFAAMWGGLYDWVQGQRGGTSAAGDPFDNGRRGALASVVEEMDRLTGKQVASAQGMTIDDEDGPVDVARSKATPVDQLRGREEAGQ